ncbi:MAG: UDP-forming cellulose synthase catalytic subunit [Pseudomonadota bacterium]
MKDASAYIRKVLTWAALALAGVGFYAVLTTPLSLWWQGATAAFVITSAFVLAKFRGRGITYILVGLSVLFSCRYLIWRVRDTLPIGSEYNLVDFLFAAGLLLAELYALTILILGYFQTVWPLHRRPVELPEDTDLWPTVDIYIPTYNEPLSVVRPTILAAMDIDWPPEKINVYVLDDGRRDEFKTFCEGIGVTHLTRPDNKHAKAGNINYAMKSTSGTYIAIFDCDHIPTRSFLQMTVGTMLSNPKMALVQTPHHFFSPDPFERNLGTFKKVPNEGQLFYGLLQDGNDFWNATFFCGSCAVIRRDALNQIGGIASETVTEDAHTALKLHGLGWESAYINIPQAAGLATESLSAHVGQRIRWARGMAQILRIDNPLFKPGLKLGQRLCYLNAMLHFLYGIPRLVFLTSPLAFLLFDAQIIHAQGWMILAYVAPHVLLSIITNSRLQGKYRHSFWAEVYETVLAVFIILPTLLALINPKLGKFNVTAKGGVVDRDYFDGNIAKPYAALFFLNLLGLGAGFLRLGFSQDVATDTVILNLSWIVYNLIILGAALAVARESKQVRYSVRVDTKLPAKIKIASGNAPVFDCSTADISFGGVLLKADNMNAFEVNVGDTVNLAIMPSSSSVWLAGRVVRKSEGKLAVRFQDLNIPQERQIVHAIYGRADAWLSWNSGENHDRPLNALFQVTKHAVRGGSGLLKWTASSLWNAVFGRDSSKAAVVLAAFLSSLIAISAVVPTSAYAQDSAVVLPPKTVSQTLTLKDLGIAYPLKLTSVLGQASITVPTRQDELVTKATLRLHFSHSPSLISAISHLKVIVNDEVVATVVLDSSNEVDGSKTLELNPALWGESNQIRFEAVQHYVNSNEVCEDPTHTSLWTVVSNKTSIDFQMSKIASKQLLSRLPSPFFDPASTSALELPFVFLSKSPNVSQLKAGAIVASWFGAFADYRGAKIKATFNTIPEGNSVVFRVGDAMAQQFGPAAETAQIRIVQPNSSSDGAILLIEAPDNQGLVDAAKALALGAWITSGSSVQINNLRPAPATARAVSPRWLDPEKPIPLKQLASTPLTVQGLSPGPIRFDFRLPPDIYFYGKDGAKLKLRYRVSDSNAPGASLNVAFNDTFVSSKIVTGAKSSSADAIAFPTLESYIPASFISTSNRLQIQYNFKRSVSKPCEDFSNSSLQGSVDGNSEMVFTNFGHYIQWPNLGAFGGGALPFSEFADLHTTGFAIEQANSVDQVTTLLTVAGHLGHVTGIAGTDLEVADGTDLESLKGRHLIIISSQSGLGAYGMDADNLPLTFSEDGVQLKSYGLVTRLQAQADDRDLLGALKYAGSVLAKSDGALSIVMGVQSPLSSRFGSVVFTATGAQPISDGAFALVDSGKRQFFNGDLTLISGTSVTGYQFESLYGLGSPFTVLSFKIWMKRHPYLIAPIAIAISMFLAWVLFVTLRRKAKTRVTKG